MLLQFGTTLGLCRCVLSLLSNPLTSISLERALRLSVICQVPVPPLASNISRLQPGHQEAKVWSIAWKEI